MIRYKMNILEALKNKGYTSYKLRNEKIIGEAMLQKIRNNELLSWKTLDVICKLLNCNICDIMQYIPEPTTEEPADEQGKDTTEYSIFSNWVDDIFGKARKKKLIPIEQEDEFTRKCFRNLHDERLQLLLNCGIIERCNDGYKLIAKEATTN